MQMVRRIAPKRRRRCADAPYWSLGEGGRFAVLRLGVKMGKMEEGTN